MIDFDGEHVIAQFIVWLSGATETSVIEIASGGVASVKHGFVSSAEALDEAFDEFARAICAT